LEWEWESESEWELESESELEWESEWELEWESESEWEWELEWESEWESESESEWESELEWEWEWELESEWELELLGPQGIGGSMGDITLFMRLADYVRLEIEHGNLRPDGPVGIAHRDCACAGLTSSPKLPAP